MPSKTWLVGLSSPEDKQVEVKVNAYTEDGAMNRAGEAFGRRFGRFPHEEEFQKIEEIHEEMPILGECQDLESPNCKA